MESVGHMSLVADLADLVAMAGFAVAEVDAPGRRKPRTLGGYRPDLVARHLASRALVIGEAKVGDDLFRSRTLGQFATFAHVLIPDLPARFAELLIAVPTAAVDDAWAALRAAGVTSANVTVAGHGEDGWQITSLRQLGAESWLGSALKTRGQS